ncbi:hypothetical protein DNTS_006140 [Danionella cerebrum]|uniref:Uncharacterized protein n=1 Tax=Danionella cerebrum TaxID=2873325 RepID=A0A553RHI9_9TELE|nr:hypothetical protein DNTS_006140 [Danionella translucida]
MDEEVEASRNKSQGSERPPGFKLKNTSFVCSHLQLRANSESTEAFERLLLVGGDRDQYLRRPNHAH